MNSTNLYKVAKFNIPNLLRNAARLVSFVNVSVTYLQMILYRLRDYAINANMHAVMTPQVCYLEKLLQTYISPYTVINPPAYEVVFWMEDEPEGEDVFISDTGNDLLLSCEYEFELSNFTVLLPANLPTSLVNHARELLDKYKLPSKQYQIILYE